MSKLSREDFLHRLSEIKLRALLHRQRRGAQKI